MEGEGAMTAVVTASDSIAWSYVGRACRGLVFPPSGPPPSYMCERFTYYADHGGTIGMPAHRIATANDHVVGRNRCTSIYVHRSRAVIQRHPSGMPHHDCLANGVVHSRQQHLSKKPCMQRASQKRERLLYGFEYSRQHHLFFTRVS